MATGLDWHVTGLWYPGEERVAYYGRIVDPGAGEVRMLQNGARTADVTVSIFDPIVRQLFGHTYARFLKVYYRDRLVFWGPAKLMTGAMRAGTVRISAMGPELRMIRHFLRRGDLDGAPIQMMEANDDRGAVTVDHIGLRILRDAALNTTGQTDRGVPDLGIIDGTNDFTADPDSRMGVHRTDQVFNAMVQLSEALGPDFEHEPTEDTVGAYAQLNTFASQGADVTGAVQLHYGTGFHNLEDLEFVDGSKYTTHVHVFSRDLGRRVTRANSEASAETGVYVDVDATDFDTANVSDAAADAVLEAYGTDILKAYSRPLIEVDLTLPIEGDSAGIATTDLQYGRDYKMGYIIGVAGRQGYVDLEEAPYRIGAITLAQASADNAVRGKVGVVADRVTAAGDNVDGEE